VTDPLHRSNFSISLETSPLRPLNCFHWLIEPQGKFRRTDLGKLSRHRIYRRLLKVSIRVLTKNSSAEVEISLRSTRNHTVLKGIPLEKFASNKDMGRILLRRGGETIAAGMLSACLFLSRSDYCVRYRFGDSRMTFNHRRVSYLAIENQRDYI
jgi:hypothetical protein